MIGTVDGFVVVAAVGDGRARGHNHSGDGSELSQRAQKMTLEENDDSVYFQGSNCTPK